MNRPFISIDPAQRFGRPVIKHSGISVEAVTEHYWCGDDTEGVYGQWGIGRPEVLLACWFQGLYGDAEWSTRWYEWANLHHTLLAKGQWEKVPDPPRKEDG